MIKILCDHCGLQIPPTSAHVVQPSVILVPGASAFHWHVDCWQKRKAEHSKPKV